MRRFADGANFVHSIESPRTAIRDWGGSEQAFHAFLSVSLQSKRAISRPTSPRDASSAAPPAINGVSYRGMGDRPPPSARASGHCRGFESRGGSVASGLQPLLEKRLAPLIRVEDRPCPLRSRFAPAACRDCFLSPAIGIDALACPRLLFLARRFSLATVRR